MTTKAKRKSATAKVERVISDNPGQLKGLVKEALEEILEAQMSQALGAQPGERTDAQLGYGAGRYNRGLVTRIGKLELRVSRDRDGRFSTELFSRYQRSEKALVSALAEMYVQGGVDAQGQGHHRGVVRSQLLGVDDFANQQDLGCRAEEVRRALA